jgi:hypothetical protein
LLSLLLRLRPFVFVAIPEKPTEHEDAFPARRIGNAATRPDVSEQRVAALCTHSPRAVGAGRRLVLAARQSREGRTQNGAPEQMAFTSRSAVAPL